MTSDFLKAAREEEARLVEELRRLPLYRRLELVRSVISSYGDAPAASHAPATRASAVFHMSRSMAPRARSTSNAAVVCKIAEDFLRQHGRRAESSVIWEQVKRQNVDIAGEKPVSVVASYLSNSRIFDNVRGQGYGLREWNSTKTLPANAEHQAAEEVGSSSEDDEL